MSKTILILSANPTDTFPLRVDREIRAIDERLRLSKQRDQFRIEKTTAVRIDDLRRALLNDEPYIVHFCGHGETNGIMLENEEGHSVLVKPEALAGLFKEFANQIDCVLLNACYSANQAEAIGRHIRCVIGMNQAIEDGAAIEFSAGFYDGLGAGRSIEQAFNLGRNAIQLKNLDGHLTPVLLKRTGGKESDLSDSNSIVSLENGNRSIQEEIPDRTPVFVGRRKVLAELIAAIKSKESNFRPLALVGMGGIGKTTLAIELIHQLEVKAALPDGVLWATLGRQPEKMRLLHRWGELLDADISQNTGLEECANRLSTLLRHQKKLLILDDVWQMDDIKVFPKGGSDCRLLVTTRNSDAVNQLMTSYNFRVFDISPLTQKESFYLLQQYVSEAVAADKETANKLVVSLGGLPLALEVVIPQVARDWRAGTGVADTFARLKKHEQLLALSGTKSRPGLDAEKPSLQAVLGMSYDSLTSEEKRAFRLLGVFGGKPLVFSLEAAFAVWGIRDAEAANEIVKTLVNRSLIETVKVADKIVEKTFYTLHIVLADFAEDKLAQYGETTLARLIHAAYYLEFVRTTARIQIAAQTNRKMFENELGQILQAFQSAAKSSLLRTTTNYLVAVFKRRPYCLSPVSRTSILIDNLEVLDTFFNRHGLWDEKKAWTEIVLALVFDRKKKGKLNNELGIIFKNKGEWDKALKHYERSRKIYSRKIWKSLSDRAGLAATLNNIGEVYFLRNELDQAAQYYERSRAIYGKLRDSTRSAIALNNLALICINKQIWGKGLEYLECSREIFEQNGNQNELGATFNNLGSLYYNKGERDVAHDYFKRAKEIFETINDQAELAHSLHNLARVHHSKGELVEAIKYYEHSRTLRAKIGERARLAETLWKMGEAYENLGEVFKAEKMLEQALAIFKELESPYLKQANEFLSRVKNSQLNISKKR